jgi:hypothetical protein
MLPSDHCGATSKSMKSLPQRLASAYALNLFCLPFRFWRNPGYWLLAALFIWFIVDAAPLIKQFALYAYLACGTLRLLFHEGYGIIQSERTAFATAAVLLVAASVTMWILAGAEPYALDILQKLLGVVGVAISYVIPVVWTLVLTSLFASLSLPIIRGGKNG